MLWKALYQTLYQQLDLLWLCCMIQKVYNDLINVKGLSPKTVKNAHGCLHKALSVAVKIGYIAKNPSDACILPKINQAEIQPFDTPEITKLLETIKGDEHEALIKAALFTGMRSGELCGLTWDCVDFDQGLIYVFFNFPLDFRCIWNII